MTQENEPLLPSVSYRTHPFRKVQALFGRRIPGLLSFCNKRGWLEGTEIEKVLNNAETIHPDDVTLTGLELTVRYSREIVSHLDFNAVFEYGLGQSMDVADGTLARYMGLASFLGSIKDVVADRAGDISLATLLSELRESCGIEANYSERQLIEAFHLSTLTKAASEMCGVVTDEGGGGSMIERRGSLFLTLFDLGLINYLNKFGNALINTVASGTYQLTNVSMQHIIKHIDKRNTSLLEISNDRAIVRANAIADCQIYGEGWSNPALLDMNSSAACEARKYASVLMLLKKFDIDMVGRLNQLNQGLHFPTIESLSETYPYIAKSLEDIDPFLEKVILIVRQADPAR